MCQLRQSMDVLRFHAFIYFLAYLVNGTPLDEQCKLKYAQESGLITAEKTFASGGCSYLCVKDGKTLGNEVVKIQDNTACDTYKICYDGHCILEFSLSLCAEKFPKQKFGMVDMGCIVICNGQNGETEEVIKQDGTYCKTPSVTGTCSKGDCIGTPNVITTNVPPITIPTIPDPKPTIPTPSDEYKPDLIKLCRKKYPWVKRIIAYPGKGHECRYFCYQAIRGKTKQLNQSPLVVPPFTPCGGSPNKVCSTGVCHDKDKVQKCNDLALTVRGSFVVQLKKDPCKFACEIYYKNGGSKKSNFMYSDGAPCIENGQLQQGQCYSGRCTYR